MNTQNVAQAFVAGRKAASGSHSAIVLNDAQSLYSLHGSVIASLDFEPCKVLRLSHKGYTTPTTRKAIGQILRAFAEDLGLDYTIVATADGWGVFLDGNLVTLVTDDMNARICPNEHRAKAASLAPSLGTQP